MKKLISKVLTLAMVISSFTVPVKADTNSTAVLLDDDFSSSELISITSGEEANKVLSWYGNGNTSILESNLGLTTASNGKVGTWKIPEGFDVNKDFNLELSWKHTKGKSEFLIYTTEAAESARQCYTRLLNGAGDGTYTMCVKSENGVISYKRSTDSSFTIPELTINGSGGKKITDGKAKLLAVGIRQSASVSLFTDYIDNIVLTQDGNTWTENFENKNIADYKHSEFDGIFTESPKFVETGVEGDGNKKIYIPANSSAESGRVFLRVPTITNGVYELSMDYPIQDADETLFINYQGGGSERYDFVADSGKRFKLTIDRDNDVITPNWDGVDASPIAMKKETPITYLELVSKKGAQDIYIDNVKYTCIGGSEEFIPEVFGEQILAKADFEDYSKTYEDYGFNSEGSMTYVGGQNGRGITAALTDGNYSYNQRFMAYDLSKINNGEALGNGTYRVRFSYNSYNNAADNNSIYLSNGTVDNAHKEAILSTETMNSYGNQWVDVDIKFEIPSLKWTATVTPLEGTAFTSSGTYTNSNGQIPAIQWWVDPAEGLNFKTAVAPAIDNFFVTREMTNTELDDSVLILVANQEMIGTKDVPVSGVSALLDFGKESIIASVSKNNVKLLENGIEIDYNGYAEGSMWVIEPAELKYGTTYAISVGVGIPDGNGAYINPRTFVFTTVKETVIPENNILGDVDFEDWTIDTLNDNYGTSDTTPGDGFTVWSTSGFVSGPDGTGQAAPMFMSGNAARTMQFWPVGKMRNATYYAEFDYKIGENYTINKFYMDRGTPEQKDVQPQEIITTDEMKSLGTGWVKVNFRIIHPSNVWSIKVTNTLGETVLEKTGKYTNANQEMTHLGWSFTRNTGATIEEAAAVDNFLMWLEYDNAPVLTKDSIKIYDGDILQSLNRISPDSDKLVVDFGQRIKASDMAAASDNVYIINRITGEKVDIAEVDYYYDAGILEISLKNAGLELGNGYTVHINAISNIASMQMEKAYDFNFTVARNYLIANFVGVTQNGIMVENGTKLTTGEAKVSIAYSNGTGLDSTFYVITANYEEGGQLKSVDYTPVPSVADMQDKTEEIPVNIEGHTTKFMIWDGFNTMNPLADSLEY